MRQGYIYIASNEAMPGIVKIGMTSKKPEKRLKSLFNTSVPFPFKLEFSFHVPNRFAYEDLLHKKLARYRVSDRREFFRLSADDAISLTERHIPQLSGKRGGWKWFWLVLVAGLAGVGYVYYPDLIPKLINFIQ